MLFDLLGHSCAVETKWSRSPDLVSLWLGYRETYGDLDIYLRYSVNQVETEINFSIWEILTPKAKPRSRACGFSRKKKQGGWICWCLLRGFRRR